MTTTVDRVVRCHGGEADGCEPPIHKVAYFVRRQYCYGSSNNRSTSIAVLEVVRVILSTNQSRLPLCTRLYHLPLAGALQAVTGTVASSSNEFARSINFG